MTTDLSLDTLEDDVMTRIIAHRQRQRGRGDIPTGVILTVCALIAGLSAGMVRARHNPTLGSESVVLADDVSLAPSSLLMTRP